jgi:uncharacterized phage protein (TIGR02218 family)
MLDAGTEWRYTSLDVDVSSDSLTYTSIPIVHRGHQRSVRGDRDSVEVVSWYDLTGPLALAIPFIAPSSLWVTIYETTYADPDTKSVVFDGSVTRVHAAGKEVVAECSSALDVLGRRVPAQMIQPRCNWILGSSGCGVTLASFTITADIVRLNGPYVDVDDGSATSNYYEHGWLTTGTGATREIRQIVRSGIMGDSVMTLSLNAPLRFATIGQEVSITAGCNGTAAMCDSKFSNFASWGGHVSVPENPSLRAIETPANGGGKK